MSTMHKKEVDAIRQNLIALGIETPIRYNEMTSDSRTLIRSSVANIMNTLGLDMEDDSLKDTPSRVAKMYCDEVFKGLDYDNFPNCTTIDNKMQYNEMIATKASVYSICEHHFVPFVGSAWIAYIPNTKILGLSKFNRVTDFFSRRPQVQERLTAQIAATLQHVLETDDVAVVIKATHMCVGLRGIQDHDSQTITSQMGGKFFTESALRQEFLALTRSR
jgi:GTP cyclohydrolase I